MASKPQPEETTMHPQSPVKLNVIVVGAGLGGLAAAISIALSGHKVTVFEATKELSEVGAGLQLTPNGTKILQQWGILDKILPAAAEPTCLVVHRYSGEILAREADFDKKIRHRYSSPFLDVHRVDLQLALYERAEELGVQIQLSKRIQTVDQEMSQIIIEDGTKASADLIVAADGLWSRCRSSFAKQMPQPTGDLAYRVVLQLDQIEDPYLRRWVSHPECHFWAGPGAHAVGYSLRNGNLYNIVLLVPDDLPEGVSRQPGSVEEMKAIFTDWDPVLSRFLGLVDQVDKWKLMHLEELPSWVNDRSNLVFLGDSCHPMLPYLAQGANSAIEDGAVLGLLLGFMKSIEQLPKALGKYETLRKARGEAIVRETFRQRAQFHMSDGEEQKKRDEIFLSQLGKELKAPFPSKWTCPQVQPWLYGYDAYQEVYKAVNEDLFAGNEPGAITI